MENKLPVTPILDQLIEKHIAFACWYNPMDHHLGIVVSNASDVKQFDRFDQLNGEAGFVFAPFRITDNCPVILLKPTFYREDFNSTEQFDLNNIEPFSSVKKADDPCIICTKDDYIHTVKEAVAAIREGDLSKVIVSRQIPVDRPSRSLESIFHELHNQTPNAFTYWSICLQREPGWVLLLKYC